MAGEGNCMSWSARDASGKFSPYRFNRRAVGPNDVSIKIAYCGICHSDIHTVRSEWGPCNYPMAPGHEIVGHVDAVGANVTTFKVGDKAAVGCMVNSCRECDACKAGEEMFCAKGNIGTYNSKDLDGTYTMGGYTSHIVVDKDFVLHYPDNLPMDAGAPLLCAGITTYSPLKFHGLDKPGTKVGVIGLGGLGHMAVKIAKAFGCHVTVISTSEGKRDEAINHLKADAFIVSRNKDEVEKAKGTLDGIIDTVSAPHELLFSLLKFHGKYVVVGAPPQPHSVAAFQLIGKGITFAGSLIGGIRETQEMLDFCAEKGIVCDIEMCGMDYINEAHDRVVAADVRYRFVLDVQGTMGN